MIDGQGRSSTKIHTPQLIGWRSQLGRIRMSSGNLSAPPPPIIPLWKKAGPFRNTPQKTHILAQLLDIKRIKTPNPKRTQKDASAGNRTRGWPTSCSIRRSVRWQRPILPLMLFHGQDRPHWLHEVCNVGRQAGFEEKKLCSCAGHGREHGLFPGIDGRGIVSAGGFRYTGEMATVTGGCSRSVLARGRICKLHAMPCIRPGGA
jgi:hypothetical protein